MSSLRRQEGYLMIDHRFSPGVPAELTTMGGKFAPMFSEGNLFESATVTCSHCHTVVVINPDRSRARNYCRKCDHYVCDKPACNLDCRPLHAVMANLQEQIFLREQAGIPGDSSLILT